jgi:hypothetical protein
MNKAAAQKTMRKVGEFVWDPQDDQTFTGPGQTVTQPPQIFNKLIGYYFSMEAPGQTLTLQVTDGSECVWGGPPLAFPPPTTSTDIGIKRGNFAFNSNGRLQLGVADLPLTPTRLTVENDARFTIAGTLTLVTGETFFIKASNESVFDINCRQIEFFLGGPARATFIIKIRRGSRWQPLPRSAYITPPSRSLRRVAAPPTNMR